MRFSDIFDSYVDPAFHSTEGWHAVEEFKHHIPARVLQMEFDGAHSNKQGIKDGQKLYKLGLDTVAHTAYIQYYDNFNQGQPTMSIVADRVHKTISVTGWQVDKQMLIRFAVVDGKVVKSVNIH